MTKIDYSNKVEWLNPTADVEGTKLGDFFVMFAMMLWLLGMVTW